MVVGIASSMLGTYVCLFINTFDEKATVGDVSKTNPICIAKGMTFKKSTLTSYIIIKRLHLTISACLLYFFTLSSFGWLSAMSHNIMTQFK